MPEDNRFVRRTQADYAQGFAALLPQGAAWPRDPDSVLQQVVTGLAGIWADPVDGNAADLLEIEADPRTSLQMLPDWERNFGLPDTCNSEVQTIDARHTALVQRMTLVGAQSRAFFINLAAEIGYNVQISEYSPFMCGISRCGDTRPIAPASPSDVGYRWQLGAPEIRFTWTVHVYGEKLSWFRCGGDGGQCGVDHLVTFSGATDLECLFRRYKPAHTQVIFDFSNSGPTFVQYKWFRCGSGGGQCGVDTMFEALSESV